MFPQCHSSGYISVVQHRQLLVVSTLTLSYLASRPALASTVPVWSTLLCDFVMLLMVNIPSNLNDTSDIKNMKQIAAHQSMQEQQVGTTPKACKSWKGNLMPYGRAPAGQDHITQGSKKKAEITFAQTFIFLAFLACVVIVLFSLLLPKRTEASVGFHCCLLAFPEPFLSQLYRQDSQGAKTSLHGFND